MLSKMNLNLTFLLVLLAGIFIENCASAVSKTPGLKAGWRFEETSGSLLDFSGNGNSGTMFNSPSVVAGKFGRALSFNGTSQYVSVANSSSLTINGVISMAVWINITSFPTSGNIGTVMDASVSGGSESYYLRVDNFSGTSMITAGSWDGSTNYYAQSSYSSWSTGQWHHIVGVYDGANWVLYFDGVLMASTAQSHGAVTASGFKLFIGARLGTPADRYFNGIIDEPRIYNKALNASQVRSLMLGYEPGEF